MSLTSQYDEAPVFGPHPLDVRVEGFLLWRSRNGTFQVTFGLSPRGKDDLCFSLVGHVPSAIDRAGGALHRADM
jgi:hypothetical protein